ncbi:RNA polymerase sigma factor [Nonomuraea sp. NPDC003560]|uniref:RNA polymerase sigma factor n=1 Tax=Nonomuraea sp. NPDC003560 TaxID=3364341 RepID=UPI003676B9B0
MTSLPHDEPVLAGPPADARAPLRADVPAPVQPKVPTALQTACERALDGPAQDSAVIEASLAEPERFAELFERHAAVLHRYVVRRLGPDQAEDVVAETFTRAFEKRHKYALDRQDALPWLYGIATNIIGTHRRAETRGFRALARTGEDPVAVAFDERVVARVSASETRRPLAAALAALGKGERDVLLLVSWGDLSYEETAQALNVPIGTVRSRLSRARRKIAHALGGSNPTDVIEEV